MKAHRILGEYQPLSWDGDGTPAAHYVSGHVTDEEFRQTVDGYHRHGAGFVPSDATIEHVFVRSVPSSSSDFEREWRHCAKGRGARPMTVWTVAPHRGEGA